MKLKKFLITLAILWSSSVSARQTGFYMSALSQRADSAFSCNVTAKFENGRFVQYTGCTIFPYTKTSNAKIRLSFDGKDNKDFLAYRPKRMETTVYVSDKVVAIREVCLVLATLY